MACITTCSHCGHLYEEASEEDANCPTRLCWPCFDKAAQHAYECKCSLCAKYWTLVPPEEEGYEEEPDRERDDAF